MTDSSIAAEEEAKVELSTPPQETSPAARSGSQLIFKAIGESLRRRRDSLGLNLDEIVRHTHVRKHYLELLERGDIADLPSSVQARGMLNNYARFLDMDVDILLLEFANGLQAQLVERQQKSEAAPESGKKPGPRLVLPVAVRRLLSPDILVGGGLLILMVVFAIWGTNRIVQSNRVATPQPTAPSISDMLLMTPTGMEAVPSAPASLEASPSAPEAGATVAVTLPPAGEGPVQVVLISTRSNWTKVLVDGKVEFEGRLVMGTAYPFDGNNQIEVITGDGSAVSIIYNQSNLGPMGSYGEVVDRIYTATTILIPSVTFTPSATISLTPTITPRPSNTPRSTATP